MWRRTAGAARDDDDDDAAVDAATRRLLRAPPPPPPHAPLARAVDAALPLLERALCAALLGLAGAGLRAAPREAPWLPLGTALCTAAAALATCAELGASGAALWLGVASATPVLRGLTESFADDAVLGWCAAGLALHVAAHDYHGGGGGGGGGGPAGALSLNAAVLSTVVLASRLPAEAHVLLLLEAGLTLFALVPRWSARLRRRSRGGGGGGGGVAGDHHNNCYRAAVAGGAVGAAAAAGRLLGAPAALGVVALAAALGVAAPALAWRAQPLRAPHAGPWDCAVVPPDLCAVE